MHIIPKPKSRVFQTGRCDISAGLDLQTLPPRAQRMAHALVSSEIVAPPSGSGLATIVELASGAPAKKAGAYKLAILPRSIRIETDDEAGLRDALASLSQVTKGGMSTAREARTLPCQTIEDYPDISHRGVMLDVSRGKIPKREKFKELVLLLAGYKYTILQLYWEDCYILKKHPALGRMNGYYDRDETAWMDALCKDHGIELQPNIQCYSHVHGILRTPGYGHLAELDTLFSFAAGNSGVYDLLDDILEELMPWFSSRTINLNMDEAYDLGAGYSKEAVARQGSHRVFLEHIRRVADIARKHGAQRIQIWGDKVAAYEGLQEELGDDLVCIDWNYSPLETFPSLENFSAERKPFWIAPGTSSWNALFPRVQYASANIAQFIREGSKKGTEGVLLTHWGDYGHHQPFSFSYHGFILGAEHSYNAGRIPSAEVDEAIDELFFADEHLCRGFKLLKESNILPGVQVGFKSQTIYAFFDDLFKGLTLTGDDHYPAVPETTFVGLRDIGRAAMEEMEKSAKLGPLAQEFLHAARCTEFTGRKGLLSYEIKKDFAAGAIDEVGILEWIQRIRLLYREFCALRHSFTQLWDAEALDIGRESALYAFDKAASRYAEAVIWLSSQRKSLLTGEPVDTQMASYRGAEGYGILWTGNCMNLWDRAYPWR